MTHSFPTRRSSDLDGRLGQERGQRRQGDDAGRRQWRLRQGGGPSNGWQQIRHGRARPALRNAGERRRGGTTERGSAGRLPRFIGGPFAVTALNPVGTGAVPAAPAASEVQESSLGEDDPSAKAAPI